MTALLDRPAARPGLFRDTGGVRPLWRVALFVVLTVVAVVGMLLAAAGVPLLRGLPPGTPVFFTMNEILLLIPVAGVTALMAWLEGRRFTSYGLAGPRRLPRLGQGSAAGVALLAVAVAALLLAGGGHSAWGGLSLLALPGWALAWAVASLLIAFTEEFAFRGYLLAVFLRRGRFWTGALLTSVIFGALHFSNSGEGLIGAADAGLAGFIMALAVRGTGSLWWSIGFHFGWDYAENFIAGTADSGQVCAGALLRTMPQGPAWLSGGATGPEGSVLALALLAGAAISVWRVFPRPANA
jgi:membrane protease YdiL (CAAX protease family)